MLIDYYAELAFRVSRILVLFGAGMVFGITALVHKLPPTPQLFWASVQIREVFNPTWKVLEADDVSSDFAEPIDHPLAGDEQPGLIAYAFDGAPRQTNVRVVDRDGQIIHEWRPRWQEIWPPDEGEWDKRRPIGDMHLHGLAFLPDGSFISNFEGFSTFRMDVCGEIVWKHDNSGHHSVSLGVDDTIWVPSEERIREETTRYIGHKGPLHAYRLQKIDFEGTVLQTINLFDVFFKNDLDGFLYMRVPMLGGWATGDTLHLNDIEVVPADYPLPIFESGDLLVSLRDIQTLMVIDPDTEQIKWTYTGGFVRQHDPDFLPSGKISIHDNRPHRMMDPDSQPVSRIIELDPETLERRTLIGEDSDETFFSRITGSHTHLENGNILVAASRQGRLLEFMRDGRLVWRYDARRSDMKNGRVYNAEVLPSHMDKAFFETAKRSCER